MTFDEAILRGLMRLRGGPVAIIALAISALSSVCTAQLADAPWPTYGRDAQRTGRSPYLGPEDATVMWRFRLENYSSSSIAVASDGTIYLGDEGGIVYAVNSDGTEKWRFQTDANMLRGSGPTLNVDGTIYIGVIVYPDRNGVGGYLYAINPDGSERWKVATGPLGHIYGTPAIGDDGTVYFGSRDNNLYAVSPQGDVIWRFPASYVYAPQAIDHDGNIYAGTFVGSPNYLHCVDRNGQEVWRFRTGWDTTGGSCIGDDGTIYAQTDHKLFAVDPNGNMLWELYNFLAIGLPSIGWDGTVYSITYPDGLQAISPEGQVLWTAGYGGGESPIIDPEGTVYFANVAVHPDGSLKWVVREGYFYSTRPAMSEDGTIYIVGDDTLYAIGPGRGKPGPTLTLTGDCPGHMAADVSGASPSGRVALIRSGFGQCEGRSTIPPFAPCSGTVLPIGGAALVHILTADADGAAHIAANVPPTACGNVCLIAVDIQSCTMSQVVHF